MDNERIERAKVLIAFQLGELKVQGPLTQEAMFPAFRHVMDTIPGLTEEELLTAVKRLQTLAALLPPGYSLSTILPRHEKPKKSRSD
jgi:hypothetical protein